MEFFDGEEWVKCYFQCRKDDDKMKDKCHYILFRCKLKNEEEKQLVKVPLGSIRIRPYPYPKPHPSQYYRDISEMANSSKN